MITNNTTPFVIIPADELREMKEDLAKILALMSGQSNSEVNLLDEYITEKQAQKMLGKKRTSLWKMRNEGKVSFTTLGGKVYYEKASILELLEENKKKRFS